MGWVAGLLYLTGLLPLWRGWFVLRDTSLSHAFLWALSAWTAWLLVVLAAGLGLAELLPALRYLASCLAGCAGVAVLGARRPGVGAWNFVVAGLLAVLLLWLAEGFLASGHVELGLVRAIFLIGTLAVGIINYLPTRLGLAAALLGLAGGLEINQLIQKAPADLAGVTLTTAILALVPWAAWAGRARIDSSATPFDLLWRTFRDRYGFMWAQRLREQFNRSASNHGWPVELGWNGLCGQIANQDELIATLQALMKRFGVLEEEDRRE